VHDFRWGALGTVWVGLTLMVGVGCDEAPGSPVHLVDAAPADFALPMDAEPDAGPVVDAALVVDAEPDADPCPEPPTCEPELERLFECRCITSFDRRCNTAADCRPGETCDPVEGQRDLRVCFWAPPPPTVCPGAEGCADNTGPLLAGAARRSVTPLGFETPTEAGRLEEGISFNPPFAPEQWNDCGLDGLCPDAVGYPGPDFGEADGENQGAWIAGFNIGRPALYCPEENIGCDGVECCVSAFAHDDIEANIAVIRQGETTVAFVALDLLGYFNDDVEQIRAELPAELGIDLLVVGATHNHEGPDSVGQWGPGRDVPLRTGRKNYFLDRLRAQVVDGITEAVANLEPVEARGLVLDTGVEGLAITDSRAPYIFDDNLPIVHLRALDDGATVATLVSYGNHAEVRWSQNQWLTADYPGATRRWIEGGLPAVTTEAGVEKPELPGLGGVTVFFAAAVGGLINPGRGGMMDYADRTEFGGAHTWAAMDAVGQRLAAHVLRGVHGEMVPLEGLRFATRPYLTRVKNRAFELAAMSLGLIRRGVYNVAKVAAGYAPGQPRVRTEVSLIRLGGMTLFTAPGEVFPETLVGGYPGHETVGTPVLGDVQEHRAPAICGPDGLPNADAPGDLPCLIRADAEYPPDWANAPAGPYVYARVPGEMSFYIGLGGDFLGYMVPAYDYVAGPLFGTAPGDHYEESNAVGDEANADWERELDGLIELMR
jgi:hypothetical protein